MFRLKEAWPRRGLAERVEPVDRLGVQRTWAGQRARVWASSVGQPSLWRTTAIVALPSVTSSGTALQAGQANTSTVSVCFAAGTDHAIRWPARPNLSVGPWHGCGYVDRGVPQAARFRRPSHALEELGGNGATGLRRQ